MRTKKLEIASMNKDEKQQHRDIWLGRAGVERLERLARVCRSSHGEVTREALVAYELSRSEFRDTVKEAIIQVIRAAIPDEQYDPVDDPRMEEAVRYLGHLLNSPFAAEGIALAMTLFFAQNPHILPGLTIPSDSEDEATR